MSQNGEASQTASEYIATQLQLESDAREVLPYQFDTCTKPLGPLRQTVFACLTCTPPPASAHQQHVAAGICYSCSISCHGEHDLVELFTKRDFVCDCGTTRYGNTRAPCNLRLNSVTGSKGGIIDDEARAGNKYDQNYAGRFCNCNEEYDPEKEKGTMFQCLGLGTIETGGCGEDWWHPECLMGSPRSIDAVGSAKRDGGLETVKEGLEENAEIARTGENIDEAPNPPGFPHEDDFDHFICYKCVENHPWLKQYAGTPGFLPAVVHKPAELTSNSDQSESKKRKAGYEIDDLQRPKRSRNEDMQTQNEPDVSSGILSARADGITALHETLPKPPHGQISLFLQEDFREHFCRCSECFPRLARHPQLLEEEHSYEPPMSESDDVDQQSVAGRSVNSGSLLERGEAALSSMDRVKAIEGIMAYNHVRDKVKEFLKPFAESGKEVGAEDIKAYFAQLRGDEQQLTS